MSEIIQTLKEKGFVNNFRMENNQLILGDPKRAFVPDDIRIVDEFRFEGNTDPDDMSILYAIETHTGEKGVLVNGYGISADPDLDAFLMATKEGNFNSF